MTMNFIYGKTLATAGLLFLLSAFPAPQASAVEVEIPGLITNRTITLSVTIFIVYSVTNGKPAKRSTYPFKKTECSLGKYNYHKE